MEGSGAMLQLESALGQAEELLAAHGDVSVSRRLAELRARSAADDPSAIQSALTESTGSMGSLRDRYLCPENGDHIAQDEVHAVNEKLVGLVDEIRKAAEAALAASTR